MLSSDWPTCRVTDWKRKINNSVFSSAGVYILYTAILAFQFKKYPIEKKVNTEKPVTMLKAIRILRKDVVFLVALVGIILSNCGFLI